MINVMMATADPTYCRGLKRLIAMNSDMSLIGNAMNPVHLEYLMGNTPAHVAVIDFDLFPENALPHVRELVKTNFQVAVLLLHALCPHELRKELLSTGVTSCIRKDSSVSAIATEIRKSYCSKNFITSDIAENLFGESNSMAALESMTLFDLGRSGSQQPTENYDELCA